MYQIADKKLLELEYIMQEIIENALYLKDLRTNFELLSADFEAISANLLIRHEKLYVEYYTRPTFLIKLT